MANMNTNGVKQAKPERRRNKRQTMVTLPGLPLPDSNDGIWAVASHEEIETAAIIADLFYSMAIFYHINKKA